MLDGGDIHPEGMPEYTDDAIHMPSHASTHRDALCHTLHGRQMYIGIDPRSFSSRGATRLGIEHTANRWRDAAYCST